MLHRDGSERATVGDVGEEPFAEAWREGAYREFRRRLLGGSTPPDVCSGCSSYRGLS